MKIAYCQIQYDSSPLPGSEEFCLRDEMKKALCALETAYSGFDNATDPNLIDCYIFQINAALKRYRFLLQEAERLHMSAQALDSDAAPALPSHLAFEA